MSQKLINLNSDLSRLRADGYDIVISNSNRLMVRGVPYLNQQGEIKQGTIISDLDMAGDRTALPKNHVIFFAGEYPCNIDGTPIAGVSQGANNRSYGDEYVPNHQISRKPSLTGGQYSDYFHKIKTYIDIICGPAQSRNSSVTAKVHPVLTPDVETESVFNYLDPAASNANIAGANCKLQQGKIAIIGVGGTGSYILDFVAKTPVSEIHLFDEDLFLNHNAFRCPGAPSLDDLQKKSHKVNYLSEMYARMRKGIIPHKIRVDESTVDQLQGMDFVFLCIDHGSSKKVIVERLEEYNIPFIDVGMGVKLGDNNTFSGTMAVTANTPEKRDHFRNRVSLSDGQVPNVYSQSIQISELSALNAALAVVKWKKICGYYEDTTKEHWCAYTMHWNQLICDDIQGAGDSQGHETKD